MTAIFLVTLISGCRSNDDYNKLGEAGIKYIDAVNLLLDESAKARVDLSSEQTLANDRISNIEAVRYAEISNSDRNRIKYINAIMQHNLMLKKYFLLLQELANSDAPQKAQTEIEKVAKNLTSLGIVIRTGAAGSPSVGPTLGSGVNLIVKLQIREALKQELEKRGKLISSELKIQEEALEKIGKIMLEDKEKISKLQENRLVVRSILSPNPIGDETGWIKTRQGILTMAIMSENLKSASSTLGNFKDIFESFLEGKSDIKSVNIFLSEVEAFVKIVSSNK
ncbi:hypothetical protein [Chamaesiphon sp. VAR_48_metabat_135_sub]|uniref:hypothetical protein n=1 Tax=Chamaesiphon sp. VAR_48_metabat_135_sub TaxID=2964699 RepID=UPI00286A52FB|nr:hypothetical protein [Chamaesiphon sp. VAR_48_metabat_135_sub]